MAWCCGTSFRFRLSVSFKRDFGLCSVRALRARYHLIMETLRDVLKPLPLWVFLMATGAMLFAAGSWFAQPPPPPARVIERTRIVEVPAECECSVDCPIYPPPVWIEPDD